MSKIDTIIFDMDGTVLDTLEDLADSTNYALSKVGYDVRTIEEVRTFVGNGVKKLIERALGNNPDEELVEKTLLIFKEHYALHCVDKTKPYAGILELMKILKASRYKLAIVSNKVDSAVKELNKQFFPEFVDVAIGERDGVNKKPAADMVEIALAELQSTKEGSVYIGDSEVDLQTAKNAGLKCITVLWGFRTKDYLVNQGAELFANTPKEIKELVDNID